MSSSSSSTQVKRACDACHRRKVKCVGDGSRPCRNCNSSGLSCTYNSVPQKKGPKGSRAKVISELRETQRQTQLAAQRHGRDSSPDSTSYSRRDGMISVEIITTCVDYYFTNLYVAQPILHRSWIADAISQRHTDMEAYCLVVSLCSYTMMQPDLMIPASAFDGLDIKPQPNIHLGTNLLQEAMRVRKGLNYVENQTVWSVITSFFFFGSYLSLNRHNLAWFHLREATTLAQLIEKRMTVSEDSLIPWLANKAATYDQQTPSHVNDIHSSLDTSFILSKMNDTIPNAPTYSFSLMVDNESSAFTDAFDGSGGGSLPASKDSTPFGSPPLSAVESQSSVFGGFQQEMELAASPIQTIFVNGATTVGMDFGGLSVPTSIQGFQTPLMYHTPDGMPYESDG